MRYLLYTILFVLLFSSTTLANSTDEVRESLKSRIDAVIVLLQDQTLEKTNRNERILDIITPLFDYQTMAKLSLGKKHWPSLSQEQQVAFSDLFSKRLQTSYLEKLDLYSDEKILYGTAQPEGKKVYIPTTLVSKGTNIEMLYKFYLTKDGWRIYDVEIGGVSVIQTYRSQFDGVLSEGTIDGLLEKLRIDGAFVIEAAYKEKVSPK